MKILILAMTMLYAACAVQPPEPVDTEETSAALEATVGHPTPPWPDTPASTLQKVSELATPNATPCPSDPIVGGGTANQVCNPNPRPDPTQMTYDMAQSYYATQTQGLDAYIKTPLGCWGQTEILCQVWYNIIDVIGGCGTRNWGRTVVISCTGHPDGTVECNTVFGNSGCL